MQDPPSAQSDLGAAAAAAPDTHDEEHMEARPDQEEMEEAIIDFLLLLEKQEKKGFKDLKAYCPSCPSLHKVLFAPCPWPTRSRQVKDQVIYRRRIKIRPT